MKLYLSSYKIGDKSDVLQSFFCENKKIAYIPNALDFSTADPKRKSDHIDKDMSSLRDIGLHPEILDLKKYFRKQNELRRKMSEFAGVWISGGNVFVLRQAMKISGFDELLLNELQAKDDFLYGGYSAAGCVLSPSLKCYQVVDHPETPYAECNEILWDGLGLIDFAFMPHFDSDHPESADIGKEIQLCKENDIPYETVRDGEVLIF